MPHNGPYEPFDDWLSRVAPDVVLTPTQERWIEAQERGEHPVWVGGLSSGRAFVFDLWVRYRKAAAGSTEPRDPAQ